MCMEGIHSVITLTFLCGSNQISKVKFSKECTPLMHSSVLNKNNIGLKVKH